MILENFVMGKSLLDSEHSNNSFIFLKPALKSVVFLSSSKMSAVVSQLRISVFLFQTKLGERTNIVPEENFTHFFYPLWGIYSYTEV